MLLVVNTTDRRLNFSFALTWLEMGWQWAIDFDPFLCTDPLAGRISL